MKKIIVDIDNTLWNFAFVLHERMKNIDPAIPLPSEWHVFDFWKNYVSPKIFYKIISGIHMDQDKFFPYPDARMFLAALKEEGFHIIIASHREKGTFDVTAKWLNRNYLIFDELHLSNDKTVLFDDCLAIIDDSPFTLRKARNAGILAAGLKMPWNEDEEYPLFDNLMEIYRYLMLDRSMNSGACAPQGTYLQSKNRCKGDVS
jgi:hypothetical protein